MELTQDKPIWVPHDIETTQMFKFIQYVNKHFGLKLGCYKDLYAWSIAYIDKFWSSFLTFSKIRYTGTYDQVIDLEIPMCQIPEWFKGITLNFAQNLLFPNSTNLAMISLDENMCEHIFTHKDLYQEVYILYHAFKQHGLKKGDIVAAILPNDHRAVIGMLATASLGCLWTSLPCELQYLGIKEKLEGISPKLIIAVESSLYGGRRISHLNKLKLLSQDIDDDQKILIYSKKEKIDPEVPKSLTMEEFLKLHSEPEKKFREIEFELVSFNHPLFIMYTSGTTGPPKKLIHSCGGTLIQLVKEHLLHGNVSANDCILFNTAPSWMMWNWTVAALFLEASIVVYDGSPIKPNPNVLWEIADKYNATVFGGGSAYYKLIEQQGVIPNKKCKLEHLRSVLSTGSYLPVPSYSYITNCIKSNIPISSISGGTDIISCFCGHNPIVPVYPGLIQAINLGMSVKCFNEIGEEIYDEFGELVCTKPFPSMPVGIVGDIENKKFYDTYFSSFKGIWGHGDYCMIDSKTGCMSITGRSDATLKIRGVRMGSGEIYSALNELPELSDSLCIGQDIGNGDERMILFIMFDSEKYSLESMSEKIKAHIANRLTTRHVPEIIMPIKDIPYTITGKKVEILIKNIVSKRKYKINRESLRNPESVELYMNLEI